MLAAALFVIRERIADPPLMSFALLRSHRNYLGATISQAVGGVAEIGLGVIFPLLLILNLGMTPAEAGLALIPTTVPMIIVSPLAGRWYDRSGGRAPLVTGYVLLAVAGVALALGASGGYLAILPGLLVYGVGLALILTTNDPVTLDSIDEADHGQASGVSATAEQGGGALGIALLYALFHAAYVDRLHTIVDSSPLPDPSSDTYAALRANIEAAEETGSARLALRPVARAVPLPGRGGLGARVRADLPRGQRDRAHRARGGGAARPPAASHSIGSPDVGTGAPRSLRTAASASRRTAP